MLSFDAWLVFAATGRILVYIWFQFPLPLPRIKYTYLYKFIEKLHTCDLCAGTWIYALLAVVAGVDMSGANSIVTQLATGAVTSFIVHVFMLGVKEKFQPPIVI